MAESSQQLELQGSGGQDQGQGQPVDCCIPVGCLTSTATAANDPPPPPNVAENRICHCCCSVLLFLLGLTILVLEGIVALVEFHQKTLEEGERNSPTPAPKPPKNLPALLYDWLGVKKCALLTNVASFVLLQLLIYKYVQRGKQEGAHQRCYVFMFWRNPTTQRCSSLYGSALQLLGLLFAAAHLGLSIWDTVALFGAPIPRMGGFSLFPLLFAAFEACVRLFSLISDLWSPSVCYVYCPARNPPPPQPQGEQSQQQRRVGALIETRRYAYEGAIWCWCAHEGCYEQRPDRRHDNIVYRQHPDLH